MKKRIIFSEPIQDTTLWLKNKKAYNEELAIIKQSELQAQEELKRETLRWGFNKLAY